MQPTTISISRESLRDMSDHVLADILCHMAYTLMVNADGGAFGGTLELMDASAIPPLRASCWQNAVTVREQSLELTDLAEMLEIRKIQPWAAMVFEEAARRGDVAYGRIGRLSNGDCAEIAMMIEDWQARHDPEVEPDERPTLQ